MSPIYITGSSAVPLLIEDNAGTDLFKINSTDTVGTFGRGGAVSQVFQLTGSLRITGSLGIPNVDTVSGLTGTVTGSLVYNKADSQVYRYSGTSWVQTIGNTGAQGSTGAQGCCSRVQTTSKISIICSNRGKRITWQNKQGGGA